LTAQPYYDYLGMISHNNNNNNLLVSIDTILNNNAIINSYQ